MRENTKAALNQKVREQSELYKWSLTIGFEVLFVQHF